MKFSKQYLSPCIYEQVEKLTIGKRVPLEPIFDEAIKCAYADGYNSGEKSAMWKTIWHSMKTDPLRVVKTEDRRGYYIDVILYDGDTYYNGTYDIMAGKFSHDAIAWKLIDKPDINKIKDREELWLQESTNC